MLDKCPCAIDAMVVLPDHIHAIWTLPEDDADYVGRWRLLKSGFAHAVVKAGVGLTRNAKGEYNLWQRRYWEHTIRDEADFERHVDYIHYNPVKHGPVGRVADWPCSSFHRFFGKVNVRPIGLGWIWNRMRIYMENNYRGTRSPDGAQSESGVWDRPHIEPRIPLRCIQATNCSPHPVS